MQTIDANYADGLITRVLASAIADNLGTPELVRMFLAMGAGSPDQALQLLNQAHDQINQVLASVALDLRTQSHKHSLKG